MKNKKEILQVVTIGLLSLNLLTELEVKHNDVALENTDSSVEYVTDNVQNNKKNNEVELVDNEIKVEDTVATELDIYNMVHEDENMWYLPLKAMKAEYNGVEYFYLHDGQGSMYISFDDLVDDEDYIGVVGKYSDTLYELEVGGFEFRDEVQQYFIDYSIMDKKFAEKLIKDIMLEI